jgi:hypothetical protein
LRIIIIVLCGDSIGKAGWGLENRGFECEHKVSRYLPVSHSGAPQHDSYEYLLVGIVSRSMLALVPGAVR